MADTDKGTQVAGAAEPPNDPRWRVVPQAEVAAYPLCPRCRWRVAPAFERCPRCDCALPKAAAAAAPSATAEIGTILVKRGVLRPHQVQLVLVKQREMARFG